MTKYENQCCDCDLYCLGDSCPKRNVPVHCCDDCEEQSDTLYYYCGDELCYRCLLKAAKSELNKCEQCGDYDCQMYYLEGDILCEDCFMDEIKEVVFND